jgi:hypothetical protein
MLELLITHHSLLITSPFATTLPVSFASTPSGKLPQHDKTVSPSGEAQPLDPKRLADWWVKREKS